MPHQRENRGALADAGDRLDNRYGSNGNVKRMACVTQH